MDTRALISIGVEFWGGIICLMAGLLITLQKRKNVIDRDIRRLLLLSAFLLFNDSLAYGFRGGVTPLVYYGVRISNALVFATNYLLIIAFVKYLYDLLQTGKKTEKLLCNSCCLLSILTTIILVISQSTGWLYYFDEQNLYHRGSLFLISQVVPFIALVILLYLLITNRDNLKKKTFFAACSYVVFPVVGTLIQVLFYGFPWQNLATVCAILFINQMRSMELQNELEFSQKQVEESDEILACAGYGIWTITFHGEDRTRMKGNEKLLEVLGIEDKNISPEDLYDYWTSRLEPGALENLGVSVGQMLEGKTPEDTYAWNHPTKGTIYIRSGGAAFPTMDNRLILRGFLGEITEIVLQEKKYKEDLENAVLEAQMANAAKSSFLARMSHDIRTPLNGIIGVIEMNERHADDLKLLQENRTKAKIAANHLLSLINDVLDMSKLEDGTVELAHEAFDLRKQHGEILTVMELRAMEKNVEIENCSELNQVDYPYVFGSPLHVRQIFVNIIGNAIKYNKPGGKVSCWCREELIDETHVLQKVFVKDTGIGMSREYLEHLFEPFSQEHSDARSIYEGTGLGMAIVKALVEKMGGTIEVESTLGEGSFFTVSIPFEIAEEKDVVKEEVVEPEEDLVKGTKILLAEDNLLNLEIATAILEDSGAIVTSAENGEEALAAFSEHPEGTFDIILMDVMMPKMNGLDATRAIRGLDRPDAKTIPIFAMTANAFAEDVQSCMEAGMNEHIAKPLDVGVLMSTITRYRKKKG